MMIATSIAGTVIGKGGDYILLDDPIAPSEAFSDTERMRVNRDFDTVFRSRLNYPDEGVIVLVMQRLHELDLTGHLLMTEPRRWTHLRLPMIAEEDEQIVFPISGYGMTRKSGDLLHPERFSYEWCEREKAAIGGYNWAGQYQQRPAPAEGGIIKRAWIKFWAELPANFDQVVLSLDATFKDTSKSDFVAAHIWGQRAANFFLLDRVHGRMDFPATIAAVRSLSIKWPQATTKLIEDKANGSAIIATLRNEISGITAVEPEGGKEARLRAVSPLWEAGNVYLPDPSIAPWVHDVMSEIVSFPNAAHDDDVDCMSQALVRMKSRTVVPNIVEFWRRETIKNNCKLGRHEKVKCDSKSCKHCGVQLGTN